MHAHVRIRFIIGLVFTLFLSQSITSSSAQYQTTDLLATTERGSIRSSEEQGNGQSTLASISADGRYVAFMSEASNLVAGDTNDYDDIFVYDRQTGETIRVSVSSSGEQGNWSSWWPSISADGLHVAYSSDASNLIDGDTNGCHDIFVHDLQTGVTRRASISSGGEEGNDNSFYPSISADGRYIVFASWASNLVEGDMNGAGDVFVHDLQTGVTEMVSVSSSGEQGNGYGWYPSSSGDMRYVTFSSTSTNLVDGDTNGREDIFVHDRLTGMTELVSVSSSGEQANWDCYWPYISPEGRFVVFESDASNLVDGDTNENPDIFIHDRQTGLTERVSISSSGEQGNSYSHDSSISSDGRYVSYDSWATNLVSDDTNGVEDSFMRDRQTSITERVSVGSFGEQGNSDSGYPSISADGRYVAFQSEASNLVEGDVNGFPDVFVHDRQTGVTELVSVGMSGEDYSISGKITHVFGNGFEGVTITAGPYSAITDSEGNYTITNVAPGSYTVTPTYPDNAFLPESTTVTVPPDANGINFQRIPYKMKILVVPLNWQKTQEEFDSAANIQIDAFIDEVPLKDCREQVDIDILDVTTQNFNGFHCSDSENELNDIMNFVSELGISLVDYDAIIGLVETPPESCPAGRSNGTNTIWATTLYDSVTAHELGHVFGLSDEYCSNQAGSEDPRCNDGDFWGDGPVTGDKNWLDDDAPCDCPPDGSNDSTGVPCCNYMVTCPLLLGCSWNGDFVAFYGQEFMVKCDSEDSGELGIAHVNYGICCKGNKIGSGDGRSIMSSADAPNPRSFDSHDIDYLNSRPELSCITQENLHTERIIYFLEDVQPIVDVNFLLQPDDSVTDISINLLDGRPTSDSILAAMDGGYSLIITDGGGNPIWSQNMDIRFDYEGPVILGVDYLSISYDSAGISIRIPRACGMSMVNFYHDDVLIFSEPLPPTCSTYLPIAVNNQ